MLRRTVTALALVPLLVGTILFPAAWVFQVFCVICITLALHEFFKMIWSEEPVLRRGLATAVGAACTVWWLWGPSALPERLLLPVFLVLLAFIVVGLSGVIQGAHHRIGLFLLGIFYVAGLGVHIAFLRALPDGIFWVFVLLAATWLNDTSAYFVGHLWGRHRIAPNVSPGKTWEGWLGGVLGSTLGVFFFWWLLSNPLSIGEALVLVGIASIFGPLGDLAESLLKRATGIKDSGQLIPGHGGILDRIDALLFNGALFYYFAVWAIS